MFRHDFYAGHKTLRGNNCRNTHIGIRLLIPSRSTTTIIMTTWTFQYASSFPGLSCVVLKDFDFYYHYIYDHKCWLPPNNNGMGSLSKYRNEGKSEP